MSKIVKVLLFCVYIVLITRCIKTYLESEAHEELVEIEYLFEKTTQRKTMRLHKNKPLKKQQNKNVTILAKIPERLPTDLKFILQYTGAYTHKSTFILKGQDEFVDAKCKHINCFITNDKSLLLGVQNFDAILFDMENYWDTNPTVRSIHQKYVFVGLEPAHDYPICEKMYDDFYNLTWTYKLDSDVTWPYFTVYDNNGSVVGPKRNMMWLSPMAAIPEEVKKKLQTKSKVAAWFVSNCVTTNKRWKVYQNLELEFRKYNLSIDVYGQCAKKQCSKHRMEDCLELVETDYYFYLAFENSMCEDYVTEKVLLGLLHYAVPIVYGGANYTRFLPPGSYINADENPEVVASLVAEAVQDRRVYEDYFRWHNHYSYKNTDRIGDACALCEALNRPLVRRTLTHFRSWWNPAFVNRTDNCLWIFNTAQ